MKQSPVLGILFDLDGTLIDSAPDLAGAVNAMRIHRHLSPLPLSALRPYASHGAKGLLWAGFNMDEQQPDYLAMRAEFLDYYEHHAAVHTRLFDGVPQLLDALRQRSIPWGIITNKYQRFTTPVVTHFGLDKIAQVIVCGDTTAHSKPHAAPMLYAAEMLNLPPKNLLYVGDDERDIQAARAANYGCAIAAHYGYADLDTINQWQADGEIHNPIDLLAWLE